MKSRLDLHMKSSFLLLFLALFLTCTSESPSLQPLNLTEPFPSTQPSNSYQYFSLTFNATHNLLELTVDQDTRSFIGIYLSLHQTDSNQAYYSFPNETHNTQECDQTSFDTCIIRLDKYNTQQHPEITVYFSVYSYSEVSYEVLAMLDDYFEADITKQYRVDFSYYESAIIRIGGDQFVGKQEIVMVLKYNTSGLVGRFKMKAAIDEVPNGYTALTGSTVGAFNKILKLAPIQNTSNYYILIQGQKNSKFHLKFDESYPSAPSITVNSSVIYHTRSNMSYHAITGFENIQLPLFIRMDSYLGYGVFSINYCGGLIQAIFQNINGENGEVAITPFERQNCKTKVIDTSFGLLAENIEIDINVSYEFGFEIGLYEGNYSVQLRLNQEMYGIFLYFQEVRSYIIDLPIGNDDLFLSYNQLTEDANTLLFQIEECQRKAKRDKCRIIASSKGLTTGELMFTPKVNMTYDVKISYPTKTERTTTLEYVIEIYSQTLTSRSLIPSKLYLDDIAENQYLFYEINLTQIHDQLGVQVKNLSLLDIHIKQLNGEVAMMTSLTIPQPTYEKSREEGSDIVFNWSGSNKYIINETTEMIYIGVRGYQEALYSIHYTLDVDADIPAKYTKLVDGTQNNFILSSDAPYQLVTFSSHIIPYKISITGNPSCIRFGYSLPLNQTCATKLPSQLTQKVIYLNISNGDVSTNNFKFSIYINSGEYYLDDKDPLLLACQETCYELVTVGLKEKSNIIHQGRGYIYELSNPTNIVSNRYLQLSCPSYPCVTKVNATLSYSGEMILYLESSGIQLIDWNGKPITFGTYPKKFIFQVRHWVEINTILIYSQAMQLDVYYNIIDIQEKQTNIITYDFPTDSKYQAKSTGNPLRSIHAIVIDNSLILRKNCKNTGSFCIVALSVYPNLNIQFNQNYKKQGVGFISSNTYQYSISLNSPFHFSGKFSMSHWGHHQWDKEVPVGIDYRVNIQPLSNCHPKLYSGNGSKNPTFGEPSYDDRVVRFNDKWMNFTVLVEKPCMYVITLTNSPFQSVIQNKYYDLKMNNNEVTVLFRSQYSSVSGFTVEAVTGSISSKIDYILVNKLQGNKITIPSFKQNTAFAVNKSSLAVTEVGNYSLYAITINSKAENIKLLVRKSEPIILIHNQEHRQTVAANSIMSYRIYSTGSIALFMVTNTNRPQITINKHYNTTNVLSTTITNQSSPWLYVQALNSELETYEVTINNAANVDIIINIMYEENDALAYKKIYEGIIAYDAFVSKQELNCYTYESPLLVGRKEIILDFVFSKNIIINTPNCQANNNCLNLQYKAIAKDAIVKSSLQPLKSNATAFRLKVDFVPKQNYTFCFHTPNVQALNLEYYVLLNDPEMDHLIQDYTLTQSYENVYDMYEIVEEGMNENVLIELTACSPSVKNERVLVGSSSFTDSENGRFTDLVEYYKNSDSIFAKLSVQEGYYYLGVKNNIQLNEFSNIYTLKFQNMGNDEKLLANTWHMKEKKIVKIFKNKKTSLVNIEVPEILSAVQSPQGNITITYTIHILNLKKNDDTLRIPLSILARCPEYHSNKLNEGFGTKRVNVSSGILKKSITFYYDNLQDYKSRSNMPVFEISDSQLPKKFNITGRIDVKSNSQKFSYYYDTTSSTYNSEEDEQDEGVTILVSILLIFTATIIVGLAAFVCYRRYKKTVQAKKVAFELANFNHAQDNSEVRREHREMLTTPEKKTKGYGQFMDEV